MDGTPPRDRESSRERRARDRLQKQQKKAGCKPYNAHFQLPKGDDDPGAAGAVFSGPRARLPYKIVNVFTNGDHVKKELEDVCEAQWKTYVAKLKEAGFFESTLAVCDTSYSMEGEQRDAAIALSLLLAALTKPLLNGVICSFSPTPQLYEFNQHTLKEKVAFIRRMDFGLTVNFQAIFNLVLKKAIGVQLPPNEMVKKLLFVSNKEFIEAGGDKYEKEFMLIRQKFDDAGYSLPGVVFWQLQGGNSSKSVVTMKDKNVTLIKGFSDQMMSSFLETNGEMNTLGWEIPV